MTTKYPDGSRVSEAFLNFDGGPSAKYVVPNHTPLAYLVIHGEPVPAGRPRFTRQGHAFDPKRSRDYKKLVSEAAALQYRNPLLHGIPLKVDVKVYRHVQSSVSKAERERRLIGEHRPIVKPDASNYLKLIEDALTGIVWEDDNLITDVSCSKYYSDDPRIEVTVTNAS
ncbi:RusA family crossover junction endodeoxyribonuclease [Levilactobacillus brevis]|nr:hypothetical protein [Lactobacillus phage JNU_P2]QHJ74924.1 hypothetical protein [Lactobacillus phage JNU_P4]